MKTTRCRVAVIALVLACFEQPVGAQSTISPLATTLASPVTDATSQELQIIRQALLLAGSSIEADMVAAFTSGPPTSTLTSIVSSNLAEFASIQSWLSTNGAAAGIDSQTINSILAQTPQELA